MALPIPSADGMTAAEPVDRENGSAREPYNETDVLYEQLDVWVRDAQGHREWATPAKQQVEFIEGRQWTDEDRAELNEQGRPALTFNRIAPMSNLMIGFYRQNRSEVRYLPGHDGAATQEVADTLTHIGKQIQEVEQYKWKEAETFNDGIFCGRGFMDVRMDWEKNLLGQVAISVFDPFSVYLDCDADAYDIAEHQRVTYNAYASIEEIAIRYGGEKAMELYQTGQRAPIQTDSRMVTSDALDEVTPDRFFGLRDYLRDMTTEFSRMGTVPGTGPYDHVDRQRRLIRVLDRQHKKLKRCRYFVDVLTGDKVVIPDAWDDRKIMEVIQAVSDRMARSGMQPTGQVPLTVMEGFRHAWRWTVTAADIVLFDDWSPYDTPTIIGFFPYFRRGTTPGFARDLIDPQMEVNKRRSALIHTIMTTANSGWMVEEGAVDPAMRDGLENEGSRPGLVVEYRKGSAPPARIQPAAPPGSLKLLEESAAKDLKEIAGINDSALGNVDRVQSGRAIEARQRQAIVAHERAFDNMARTRELFGRKQMDLIQTFYTTDRIIRVRGEGQGKDMVKRINERDANDQIINDVVMGRYTVVIDESPASATFQQTQFDEMMELVKMLPPQFVAQVADLIVDASSVPQKAVFKQRLLMLNQAAAAQEQMRMQGIAGLPQQQPGMAPAGPGGPQGAPPMGGGGGPLPPPGNAPGGAMPMQPMARPNMPMPGGPMPAGAPNPGVVTGPMGVPMRRPPPR